VISLSLLFEAHAAELKIGTWNIANLHHENNFALREGAQARDAEDYDRLRAYAATLDLDIVALQEIGSPQALARIFPAKDYHLIISSRYVPGDEYKKQSEREIFNAFAVRKSRFPELPAVDSLAALSLTHLELDKTGAPDDRPTRDGMILHLSLGDRQVSLLNVHLKSSCNEASLDPVHDIGPGGVVDPKRYDCRTLAAQAAILENWIEQQREIGRSVIVLGDFNRRMNKSGGTPGTSDQFWEMINDGEPNGLQLRKGPLGKNTTCWPAPHPLFHDEHIEFIVFDSTLDGMLKPEGISKVALPYQDDPKYKDEGERLSDHCPVVATLNIDGAVHLATDFGNQSFRPEGALKWMRDSAEYHALALSAFAAAGNRIEEIARQRPPGAAPWIVVIDADETLLDNLQFESEGKQRGLKWSEPRWREWVGRRAAGVVPGAAGFFSRVLALGGKIAIVSNRFFDQAADTAENLDKLGLSSAAERVCILVGPKVAKVPPYGNDKDERFAALREGTAEPCWKDKDENAKQAWARPQDIVMQLGDNVQDFPGLTQKEAAALPEVVSEHLGRDWFLLPNAAYGSWQDKGPDYGWIEPLVSDTVKEWSNLSGLAAHPTDPDILFAVTDRASPPPRILRIDVSARPPKILDAIELSGCGAGLDLEGIAAKKNGGFWLASEGGKDNQRTNLLLEVDGSGHCLREVPLPEDVRDRMEDHGFEGVTLDEAGKVYVAFQAPLPGEEDARIGKFDPATNQWSFFYYPLEEGNEARVGLSEILYLGSNRFAAIERDDKGHKAEIKWITTFELPPADPNVIPTVRKRLAVDLIDYFDRADRDVEKQIEGLAITARDGVFVVTDDDPEKETLLIYLGKVGDTGLKH
jgi:predicted secreted acid phosphatase/endonuclease/exonuclease/phosphatase family metal-dependent hydrolase